jgi:hypothetical protein
VKFNLRSSDQSPHPPSKARPFHVLPSRRMIG